LAATSTAPAQSTDAAAPVWHDLAVPGGPSTALAAAGLPPTVEPWRVLIEIVRRLHGAPPEDEGALARMAEFDRQLSAAQGRPAGAPIPLPLSPATWRKLLPGASGDDGLFHAIATDRRAALLYHGLMSQDEETLRFLEANPALLDRIYRERAAVFATLGRSIHVANGEMHLPGGADARALWEAMAGAPASAPARFIESVLDRDRGRLAYFFDTLLHLPEPRYRFALGVWMPDERRRRDRFEALYRTFVRASPEWDLQITPFARTAIDPALVLGLVRVEESGHPVRPAWRSLWEAAFSHRSSITRRAGHMNDRDLVDAAWVATEICVTAVATKLQRERLETLLFAQRAFHESPTERVGEVLDALRSFRRYPVLLLTLERMGVTDPLVYLAATRRADQVTNGPESVTVRSALAQLQGSLGLLERIRYGRILDATGAAALVRSLLAVEPDQSGAYQGRLAAWIERELLPALASRLSVDPDAIDAEELLLKALAGSTARETPQIHWEGTSYAIDPGGMELARLREVRNRQRANRLDRVISLAGTVRRLLDAATADALRASATALPHLAGQLQQARPAGLDGTPDRRYDSAVPRALERIQRANGTLPKMAGEGAALVAMADAQLGDALMALLYASALGDPDGRAFLTADVSRRHDFGLELPAGDPRSRMAWSLATEQSGPDTPWHLTGSILALDLALPGMSLRRTATDAMPRPPRITGLEARAFAESVALMNPHDLSNTQRDTIASAIEAGRNEVAGRYANPAALQALGRGAGVNEWRLGILPWLASREPARISSLFSLTELMWLGGGRRGAAGLEPWGVSAVSTSGCLCLDLPAPSVLEGLGARPSTPSLGLRVPDLKLRVAEALAELGLPAVLARGVLSGAMQDMIDGVRPLHGEDTLSVAQAAREWPRNRIEDYVAALTSVGPLAPIEDAATASPWDP
jgi:hypothetical protein